MCFRRKKIPCNALIVQPQQTRQFVITSRNFRIQSSFSDNVLNSSKKIFSIFFPLSLIPLFIYSSDLLEYVFIRAYFNLYCLAKPLHWYTETVMRLLLQCFNLPELKLHMKWTSQFTQGVIVSDLLQYVWYSSSSNSLGKKKSFLEHVPMRNQVFQSRRALYENFDNLILTN